MEIKKEVMEFESVTTKLLEKTYSPLLVRKYQALGWPLWVGVICDSSVSQMDNWIWELIDKARSDGIIKNDLQSVRNFCGFISENLVERFNELKAGSVEGIAVIAYWDKCFCSSLYGDFMTHLSCKLELYQIINTLPHI